MSTATFVQQLYTTLLGRTPDSAGVAFWSKAIDSGAVSAATVTQSFLDSPEFADAVQPVARLYIAAFGRIPDEAGLSFWTQTAQAGTSLDAIAQAFTASAEFQGQYGKLGDAAFVDALYQVALGHAPETGAKAEWLAKLAAGAARTDVLSALAGSAEMSAAKAETVKIIATYHGTVGAAPTQQQIDAALAAHDPTALISSLYASPDYHGAAVPGLGIALATVSNALTQLAHQFASAQHLGLEAAAEQVQAAFGLSSTLRLLQDDPAALATAATLGQAQRNAAAQAHKVEVQLENLVDDISAALRGLGVHATAAAADGAVLQAVANLAASGQATSLNLASLGTVQGLIGASAKLLTADPLLLAGIGGAAPQLARGIVAVNAAIGNASAATTGALLDKIATIDANAAKLAASLLHGDLAGALDATSASALNQPVDNIGHGGGASSGLTAPPVLVGASSSGNVLTLTFSEDVHAGSGTIYFTDGATQTVVSPYTGEVSSRLVGATDTRSLSAGSSQVVISGNEVTITLSTPLAPHKSYSVIMDAGSFVDDDNLSFAGLVDSSRLRISTNGENTAPHVVSLTLDHTEFRAPVGSATMTIVFSEAVSGVTVDKFTVPNGKLEDLATTDNITWTATFKPDPNVSAASNHISFATYAVQDAAGNAGMGSFASPTNYAVNTFVSAFVTAFALEDSGLSDSDGITNIANQMISGSYSGDIPDGSAIEVLVNGVLRGNADIDTANHTFSLNGAALDVGDNDVSIHVKDGAGNASFTLHQTIKLDTSGPLAALHSYAVADALTLDFNEAVYLDPNGSGSITLNGGTGLVTITPTVDMFSSDHKSLTIQGANTLLDNQTYSLNLPGNLVDAAGNPVQSSLSFATGADGFPHALSAAITTQGHFHTGAKIRISVQFDEAVTVNATTPPTLELGIGSALRSASYFSGSGTTTLVFEYVVQAGDTDNLVQLSSTAGLVGAIHDSDNNLLDAAHILIADASGSAGVDNTAPQPIALTVSPQELSSANNTATVTLEFSEPVKDVDLSHFTVSNGVLSDLVNQDGDGITWTATFTAASGVTAASNAIGFDAAAVSDLASNLSTGTIGTTFKIDTAAPTVESLTLSDNELAAGESATVTLVFSEKVGTVPVEAFDILSGSLSEPVSSDDGITWTATLTPTADTTALSNTISFDASVVGDLAGNAGSGTTTSANYVIDTARPTATVALSDSILHAGETSTVTVTFSEAVTGLTESDFSAPGGTISNVSTANGGGITWTATFTPDGTTSTTDNSLQVDLSGVTDAHGNAGTGLASHGPYTVDTIAPTATSISLDKTSLKEGDTATATIVFSEAISALAANAFTVTNGALSDFSSSDNVTWTATFTPDSDVTAATNAIVVNASAIEDQNGNAGTNSASTTNFAIDTAAPTLTLLTFSDVEVGAGDTPTVTLVFSEAVSGVEAAGFSYDGGTLGTPTSNDGITWSATFTPAANQAPLAASIAFDASTVTDSAGNAGSGSMSVDYSVDTSAPQISSVSIDDTSLLANEEATVTVVFSEAVYGLTSSNFSFNGGMLGEPATVDHITWTATFTPDTELSVSGKVITVDTTDLTDEIGNAVTGGPLSSESFLIDTSLPDISGFSIDTASLKHGDTATVTLTFSEAVADLDNVTFSSPHASLSGFASSDGGTTWTATLAPTDGNYVSGNVIALSGTVTDLHGNEVTVSDTSPTYDVDTTVTTTISSLHITDNGVSDSDYITNSLAQTIDGTYSADLSGGAYVEINVNDSGFTQVSGGNPATDTYDYSGGSYQSGTNTVVARINDGSGHTGQEYSLSFTIDTQAPTLASGPVATGFDPDDDIVLGFDQTMYNTNDAATITLNGGPQQLTYTLDELTISGGTVTIPTAGDLNAGYSYTLTLPSALSDEAGNAYDSSIPFSTEAATHATAATYTVNVGWTTLNTNGTLSFTVDFGATVTVTGVSKLLFETGSQDGYASIAQGSSGTSLTYTYTVQSGEYTSALALHADFAAALVAGLTDANGNPLDTAFVDFASLTNDGTGSGVIVDTPPLASSISGLAENSDHMDTDVGWSTTDGITVYTIPNLAGSGARPNTAVLIYEGSTVIGSGTADANGDYNIRLEDAGELSGGDHTVHAVVLSSSSVEGDSSGDYTFTIDSSALSVSNAPVQASDRTISFTFSEAVQWTATESFTILGSDQTTVAATIDAAHTSISGNTVTLDPGVALSDTTLYYIDMPTSLTDIGGHTLSSNPSFTTLDLTAPVISAASPADGGFGGPNLNLTFSEQVQFNSNTHIYVKDATTSTTIETLDGLTTGTSGTGWSLSTTQAGISTLTITLSGATLGEEYYVEFGAGAVTDLSGNEGVALVGGHNYQFTYSPN